MEDREVAFDNRFTRAFGTPRERIRNKVRDALQISIRRMAGIAAAFPGHIMSPQYIGGVVSHQAK
jgi:hypothetical protein